MLIFCFKRRKVLNILTVRNNVDHTEKLWTEKNLKNMLKNVFKQEAKSPPPQWAFITQEVREKFSPKKVRTRLKYKNQVIL